MKEIKRVPVFLRHSVYLSKERALRVFSNVFRAFINTSS